MHLNAFGEIVQKHWYELPNHYPHVHLDAFVIMPNHIHGILVLLDTGAPFTHLVGAGFETRPYKDPASRDYQRHALPEIVRGFKTYSARAINSARGTPGVPVWQRSFYDHVIRNEHSLYGIREYIAENPARWAEDRENPVGLRYSSSQ
jgi:REP element-mobilizing transposase RayT